MKVLVVEDEAKIAEAIRRGLESDGYQVAPAANGEEAFFRAQAESFDLLILDLMLPGRDGLEILSTLRRQGVQTPVLILTARDTVEDRVAGLDSGADDYLVKPFAFPELLARVRALLRRGRPGQAVHLRVANLEIDLLTRKVTRDGRALHLTGKEYEILEYLLRHQGRVVSREMLAHDVWGEPCRASTLDNVIDVYVNRLRKLLQSSCGPRLIHTIRGVGFILQEREP